MTLLDFSDAGLTDHTQILRQIGLGFLLGDVVYITNMEVAKSGHIHHTYAPVAALGYAMAEPCFSKGRFPKMTLESFVLKRPALDSHEAAAIARITHSGAIRPSSGMERQFADALFTAIHKYQLTRFFYNDPASRDIYLVRPKGFGPDAADLVEVEFSAWRKSFRALSPELKIMVATIVWLYYSRAKAPWLKGIPHDWHIADAVTVLREVDMLADWGRLIATYSGW